MSYFEIYICVFKTDTLPPISYLLGQIKIEENNFPNLFGLENGDNSMGNVVFILFRSSGTHTSDGDTTTHISIKIYT